MGRIQLTWENGAEDKIKTYVLDKENLQNFILDWKAALNKARYLDVKCLIS